MLMGAALIDVVRPSGTPSTHNAPPHPTTSEGSPHSFIAMPIGSKNIFMDTSPVFTIYTDSHQKNRLGKAIATPTVPSDAR